jgi:hypothetical protein
VLLLFVGAQEVLQADKAQEDPGGVRLGQGRQAYGGHGRVVGRAVQAPSCRQMPDGEAPVLAGTLRDTCRGQEDRQGHGQEAHRRTGVRQPDEGQQASQERKEA